MPVARLLPEKAKWKGAGKAFFELGVKDKKNHCGSVGEDPAIFFEKTPFFLGIQPALF